MSILLVLSDVPFDRSIITWMSTILTSLSSSSTLGSQKGMAGVNLILFSLTGRTGFPAERFFL